MTSLHALAVGTVALCAPALILGPAILSGHHLTPWFWLALALALAGGLGAVAAVAHRERLVAEAARRAERERGIAIAKAILSECSAPAQPPASALSTAPVGEAASE